LASQPKLHNSAIWASYRSVLCLLRKQPVPVTIFAFWKNGSWQFQFFLPQHVPYGRTDIPWKGVDRLPKNLPFLPVPSAWGGDPGPRYPPPGKNVKKRFANRTVAGGGGFPHFRAIRRLLGSRWEEWRWLRRTVGRFYRVLEGRTRVGSSALCSSVAGGRPCASCFMGEGWQGKKFGFLFFPFDRHPPESGPPQ